MGSPIYGYELLKDIICLAHAPIKIEEKLHRMLQSVREAFHAESCLLLGPDEIEKNEALSRLAREKRASWQNEGPCACFPVYDEASCYGLLQIGLIEKEKCSPEEWDLLLLISKEMAATIQNDRLQCRSEQLVSELAALCDLERMTALSELSASIAHEIRNPLVAIGGFARRLGRTIPEEGPEKRYADTIIEEVTRIEKFLRQVQAYTGNNPRDNHLCDLRDILEESISMISRDGERIRIVKEFPDRPATVRGDRKQLKQAFFNLIANAHQAMEREGVLSVRAFPASGNGSSWVRVEVEDSGAGIVPENLHHIFNPFFTTRGSSLGLGLPIAHKIVTSHQGRIEVDNRPGQGVTFIVTLPAPRKPRSLHEGEGPWEVTE
jgi:two-component system, NtrC family, sensor histidine kinase HydH